MEHRDAFASNNYYKNVQQINRSAIIEYIELYAKTHVINSYQMKDLAGLLL